ncbi:MAG TPA: B12-binding domain-containing radical SAM protein [Thermoanaerobaculia bacterium]|nr:B12-binding domain-containing radical SAM protein [Thermoanaerobaculia bacterium]
MVHSPKVLLVYPAFPPSYWGFQYALELVGKRASMPPLGLITVAAMFPAHWRLRLVDMNVTPLRDEDLDWADLVLTSTMVVQRGSLRDVIARANARRRPVAVGGPHPTSFASEIAGADHYLLDEVEETFPRFLADWEAGKAARVYRPERKPAITATPVPRFELLDLDAYGSMALQFSRGCPFDCEFCDITKLFGRVPRTKSNQQMLSELDHLHALGWRGAVFLVDDNFIGNKKDALRLLPAVADWQRERGYPFDLYTEASVNLAKLEPLLDAMVDAGFTMTFLGIESPNPEALRRTKKVQNTDRDDDDHLLHAVTAIQRKGIEVTGGFILGLDGDGPEVFDAQVAFIQEAGIPMAMVGLLSALRGTDLYARLEREGRLLAESTGNNVEITLNFEPELDREVLISGYRRVLETLYDERLETYFERCWTLLSRLGDRPRPRRALGAVELRALARSLYRQLLSRQGPAYLKFLARTLIHRPALLDQAVRLAIKGLHFRKFTAQTLYAHEFHEAALAGYREVEELADRAAAGGLSQALARAASRARRRIRRLHRRLYPEFRHGLLPDRARIERAIQECVGEVPGLELLRRWTPQVKQWFAQAPWHRTLLAHGYQPAAHGWVTATPPTVTLVPVVEAGRLRRALELYFRELGVEVMSASEQLAALGHERLERLHHGADPAAALLAYLRELGRKIDAVVVPVDGALGETAGRVQWLSPGAASLPAVIAFSAEQSRVPLRASLLELGELLTGDAARAERAFESAFALL